MSSRSRPESSVSRLPVTRPWRVIAVWLVALLALTPLAIQYTHSINYAGSSSSSAGSESAKAQAILSSVASSHSTLLVLVDQAGIPSSQVENETLAFQAALAAARLPYWNGSSSVYTAYATYLDGVFGADLPQVRGVYANVSSTLGAVYGFPSAFLSNWTALGPTASEINASAVAANGSSTGYDAAIRDWLLANFSGAVPPAELVQRAVIASAPGFMANGPVLNATLANTNVTAFRLAAPNLTVGLLAASGLPGVPTLWVVAATYSGDFGSNVVRIGGLAGLPSFLRSQFVSPDGTTSLVEVVFNVSDTFRTADGTYPAQAATFSVRTLAEHAFGPTVAVTGPGAVAYDAQQLTAGSGALFALTFLFLAIAVALTLRSWIAPLLALLLISFSTIVGYLAIELTGLVVAKVDFTVTYTLTAVTLGVATDYALFFLYRYREELTKGTDPATALTTARRSSGFAILVSATTVAVGLGTLSFLSGLSTWGLVLCVTVLVIGLLEVTFLPALMRLLGPRIFLSRWLRPAAPAERSVFYRAARRSGRRAVLVGMLALVIAVPATLGFVFAPTSYNFAAGLPSNTPSAQGQQLLEQKFGANLLFPTYVIVTAQGSFVLSNGSPSPEAVATLPGVAADLLHRSGVRAVDGPYVSGTNLTPANGTGNVAPFSLESGHAVYFVVYSLYDPYSTQAISLVESLRSNPSYLVGGVTSAVVDQQNLDSTQYPLLELLLTVFIGVILGVAFRSAWAPLISISGVFLSITSTTGLLYVISAYVLHTDLLWLIPLILFVILMSLGNDYTVFLLSRVREEQGQHGPLEGIPRGIAGSGVVVSALGLILAASLGSLALQRIGFLQEIGIAFVLSLLLDTFVVRPFYFPAMLTLVERRKIRRQGSSRTTGRDGQLPR